MKISDIKNAFRVTRNSTGLVHWCVEYDGSMRDELVNSPYFCRADRDNVAIAATQVKVARPGDFIVEGELEGFITIAPHQFDSMFDRVPTPRVTLHLNPNNRLGSAYWINVKAGPGATYAIQSVTPEEANRLVDALNRLTDDQLALSRAVSLATTTSINPTMRTHLIDALIAQIDALEGKEGA